MDTASSTPNPTQGGSATPVTELSTLDEKILTCPVNTEMVLSDAGYRKHLIKHSNKYVSKQKGLMIMLTS